MRMRNIFFVGAMALTLISTPFIASAAELRAGEQPVLSADERIVDDFYIAGGNVNTAGTIVGDMVAVGGNVVVDGSVSQDLSVAGGNVTVLANVGDDLRAGGGSITIAAAVGDDVIVGGGQVQISGDGVGGDVVFGGGVLTLNAPVSGDVTIAASEVLINAPIAGDVSFRGEKLTLGSGAEISGTLTYTSPKEAEFQEGAVVRGETVYEQTPQPTSAYNEASETSIAAALVAFASLALLAGFLMKLTGALVIGLIFHRYSERIVNDALTRPLPELGRGFAVFALLPIASVMLLITIIGVPLAGLGFIAFAALMLFASLVAPIALGALVHRWVMKPATYEVSWKTIILGVVLYGILNFIPVIGWIAKLILMLVVIGAISKIKWDMVKQWR